MRPSRVLARMRRGEVASCIKLNLKDSRVVEIAALCGFDCVWLDLEHVPNTLADIEHGIRSAKTHDVDTLVRVPRGSYSDLIYPLEMDAAGIMVPHLMNCEDARKVVWQTRFHPVGRRPLDGGNADGSFCMLPINEYISQANEQRMVIVQIEDPEPVMELEEIAAVDGIDMLFFGPGDFSQGIGAPGQFNHPEITRVRELVARVARRFVGTVGTAQILPSLLAMGYQFISIGADVVGLSSYFTEITSAFGAPLKNEKFVLVYAT